MNVLCVGDVVSRCGRTCFGDNIEKIKREYKVDFVIVNGENVSHGHGMSRKAYEEMMSLGADFFTMGNHSWGNNDIKALMSYNSNIIRPANYNRRCPGKGSAIVKTSSGAKLGIINISGVTYMSPAGNPFDAVEREIKTISNETNIILVDFHAEATSEKVAMGWFLDGKVSAVFGTHTHIQTSDEAILPNGTGYITDLGMTGAYYSVLGMERKIIIDSFLTGMPQKFEVADGKSRFCGCVFEIDEESGKTTAIHRINLM